MKAVDAETAILGPGWPRAVERMGREAAARARLYATICPEVITVARRILAEETRRRTIAECWKGARNDGAVH